MEESFEQELKDMANRAAQIESLNFSIEFDDEETSKMAYAIEYGHKVDNTIIPPCPFMRLAKEFHEGDWSNLLNDLGSMYIEGDKGLSIEKVASKVAERMEDDYKDSALTYGVPPEIYDKLHVTW